MVFPEMTLDAAGRQLVNLLQEGLPLEKDPYGILAGKLGISRSEIAERVRELTASGYIRRVGGIFDPAAMGYSSTLVGMRVPEDIFGDVTRLVNDVPGVTHNYRRKGFLNMWFTLSTAGEGEKDALLQRLSEGFGLIHVYEFPRARHFKLRVFFDMERE
ncbi:MAG: Lrp/AsnC family transcriptional regulator [Synergistales bacterium]|jgi:DNA-binding Lrp family transcriptional regulator|nr:Lrp/AsnC family transcriptional regulator [Synergistaceae bacterium]NCC56277.1 Lrp/AsnC family transcriptional regulator [Synergistales bacterium]